MLDLYEGVQGDGTKSVNFRPDDWTPPAVPPYLTPPAVPPYLHISLVIDFDTVGDKPAVGLVPDPVEETRNVHGGALTLEGFG